MSVIIIVGILSVIILLLCKIFDPQVEATPLSYNSGLWLIVWYNDYRFENKKLIKGRMWFPLMKIKND